MKKLTTTILGLILFATFAISQDQYVEWVKELSKKAIKQGLPDYHGQIVKEANKNWGTDYEMVAYEIKNQCKAFYDFLLFEKPDGMSKKTLLKIQTTAQMNWGEFDKEMDIIKMDWEMALYEIKNQIEAYFEIF